MPASNNHRCPRYIPELLTATSSVISRSRPRSASSNHYKVPRIRLTFEDRAFSIAGPTAWNSFLKKQWTYLAQNALKHNLRLICVLWHIAIFIINYVIRLWSQGGDVTHFIIFGCERHIRKCTTINIIIKYSQIVIFFGLKLMKLNDNE